MSISDNELKTKGVSIIESNLDCADELIITVQGKERFVVMDMEHYNHLRECELQAALHQGKADVEVGDFVIESVNDHIKRITNDL
ncbi:MAG: hypothetical protein WBM44_09635 [Waterburya sp.]